MQNFNITLKVKDCLICKGCKNIYEKESIVTSSQQVITLLNGYILNVISVSDNRSTVLIQNGQNVFIRNIYNFDTKICISNKTYSHLLSISYTQNT